VRLYVHCICIAKMAVLPSRHLEARLNGYRLESVERVGGGGEQHSWDLRVPMQFFDVLLTLVNKE
jgi:hypothetical protein